MTSPARVVGIRALLLVLLMAFGIGQANAQTFPKLTGRVVDAANLFQPAQRAALEAKLANIQQTTGHQVVVATIPNLQGYPLEDYGYKLGRAWGIGSKAVNDGVVVFVAPNEPAGHRGPRIEVGYGLEPLLTDAFTSGVALNIMTPKLRAGDPAGAFNDGIDAIAAQIKLTPEEAAKRSTTTAPTQHAQPIHHRGSGGSIIFWIVIFLFVILPMLRGLGGRRYGGGGGGGLGNVLLWGALSSLGNSGSSSGWGGGGPDSGGGDFGGGGGSFGGGGASGDW